MILNVPYQSQEPFENASDRKWCALTSLWMVMAYYLKDSAPSMNEIIDKYSVSFEAGGFAHKDLLNIARDYGLRGFRKSWWASPGDQDLINRFKEEGEIQDDINDWSKTNLEEGLFTLEELINTRVPVIVSVSPEFSPSNSTHMVVLIGSEGENFIIHDPYKRGSNFKINKNEFKKYWLKQAVIVKEK